MSSFLQTQSFINNKWINAGTGKTFPVYNPSKGEVVAEVADCGVEETEAAIIAAYQAFSLWSKRTAKERGALMKRWFDLIIQHADDLALLMTTEQGKPLAEAKGEVLYGASLLNGLQKKPAAFMVMLFLHHLLIKE